LYKSLKGGHTEYEDLLHLVLFLTQGTESPTLQTMCQFKAFRLCLTSFWQLKSVIP